jgi:hypothetical protein
MAVGLFDQGDSVMGVGCAPFGWVSKPAAAPPDLLAYLIPAALRAL